MIYLDIEKLLAPGVLFKINEAYAMIPTYAVVYRTHTWDDFIRAMALHTSLRVKAGKFFVMADETKGTLPVIGFEKISITNDFSDLGLDVGFPHPERFMWYNGDFPFYRLLLPEYDYEYVCMMDYDALANCDFDCLVEEVARQGFDFVGYRFDTAPDNIGQLLSPYSQSRKSILPCILIIENLLLDPCLKRDVVW